MPPPSNLFRLRECEKKEKRVSRTLIESEVALFLRSLPNTSTDGGILY